MKFSGSVADYVAHSGKWREAVQLLRDTITSEDVEETIKWGAPTYTVNNKNIIGISAFKSYVGIWFHQGVFLTDPQKKLINAQEGVTKALRQWRFSSLEEVRAEAKTIRDYVREAIANQKAGQEMKPTGKKLLVIPDELQALLRDNVKVKDAYEQFTPFLQREFAEYIASAKRPETRHRRISKIAPMILRGEGLNDNYRK